MKRTATALALLALVLYGPGILLPALHVEKLGCRGESSILESCALLFGHGEVFLGLVVGLSALVLPPIKLTVLLWLAAPSAGRAVPGLRLRLVEAVGRFGCLEVFLSVFLISFVRLSSLVSFQALAGLYFFALSALIGLAASAALGACGGKEDRTPEPRALSSFPPHALSIGCKFKEYSHESRPCHA
jgi:uncharacterized paraquat-inducible protein A